MRVAAVLVAGFVAVSGCAGGGTTADHNVPVVVAGPASAWSAMTVSTPSATKDVPADAREQLAPLRAARALDRPEGPSAYGLDHPRATLSYRPASSATAAVDVDIGNANFDRHFVYVQQRGRPTIYLVPADTLRSTLAMVGIEDRPPDD